MLDETLNENTLKAIKKLTDGMILKEVTEEFVLDDDGDMKLVKKKVNSKTIPPNFDVVKMIYSNQKDQLSIYEEMSDEELENERQKVLREIQMEEENGNTKH